MNLEVVISDFTCNLKMWYRSKGSVFWTLAFPIFLMLMFGAIFSGQDDISITLHVQDLDCTNTSAEFIDSLGMNLEIEEIPSDRDAREFIKENDIRSGLIIPDGFQDTVASASMGLNSTINVTLLLDPTQESTNGMVRGVIGGTLQAWNMGITNSRNVLGYEEDSLVTKEFKYIDFFLPGVIGMSIMSSSIYGTIFRNTKYRNDGILRKLATTPMTHSEYLLAKMVFMTFMSFLSAGAIILVGILAFDISVSINAFVIVIIISASFAFSGMGLIITRFVKEEETADSAGGAVTFPQMFLAGTFFPLEIMPAYLGTIAKLLPLYYVNQGLRDAMVNEDWTGAITNTGIVFALAAVFFVIGALLTKWKED